MEAVKRKKKHGSKAAKKQEKDHTSTVAVSSPLATPPPSPVALSGEEKEEETLFPSTAEQSISTDNLQEGPVSNGNEQTNSADDVKEEPSPKLEEMESGNTKDEKTTDFTPTAPPCGTDPLPVLTYPGLKQFINDAAMEHLSKAFKTATTNVEYESHDFTTSRARTLYLECIVEIEQVSLESERQCLDALEYQFVTTESPLAISKDPGDYDSDLLLSLQLYQTAYHSCCEIMEERAAALKQISSLRGRCWDFQQVKFTASGQCDDARLVTVSIKNRVASLNVERCKEAKAEMSTLTDRCVTKEKESIIQLHHTRAMVEKNVFEPPIPGYERSKVLRHKLRIIGNALRTEMHEGGCDMGDACEYVQDLRKWFIQIGTSMLCAGSTDERVWLMFHLLRFPNGIGTWAHVLAHPLPIGKQNEPLTDNELNTVLTLAYVLVRPIIARETFLAPVNELTDVVQAPSASAAKAGDTFEWVDSDGEDSSTDKRIRPIKESDLLALLDQMPFRRLFRTITNRCVERIALRDVEQIPVAEILRLTTFASKMVAILGEGLAIYGGGIARYNHFAQRLALLINDTVKFVGDVLRFYRYTFKKLTATASDEMQVVQVHFDTLVYRAARVIFGGGVALARHIATLPFALLSSRACWWMFDSMVNRNFYQQPDFNRWQKSEQPLRSSPLVETFKKQLSKKKSPHDLYNMLKPLVDLALARNASSDGDLVSYVAKTLLETLAVIPTDELVCAQIVMEQIHILMERTSSVLSGLLETFLLEDAEDHRQTIANDWQKKGNLLLEVFSSKKQVIIGWKPSQLDFTLLEKMLLNYPRTHIYHKLALGLLMYINYGDSSRLYVPKNIQTNIAYNLFVAFRKNQLPKTNPDGSAASVAVTAEQQTEFRNYQERCLFILLQLHIHALDQPSWKVRPLLQEPWTVSELTRHECAAMAALYSAIKEQCPVASLCALLYGRMGHCVPVFCQDGMTALNVIYGLHQLDTVVVRCLELITLLFVDCPLALSNNAQFITMLTKLVDNDDMLDWSRHTIDGKHHTVAVKLLEGARMGKMGPMLVSQAAVYWRLEYATPPALVCMWFDCFAKINRWTNNPNVLRLMNVLASISVGHTDAWNALRDRFRPFFKSMSVVKQKQHSLWAKIIGTEPPLLYGTLPNDCIALALLVYEIEHQELELKTELWPRLLRLIKKNHIIKLDAALREINGTLRIQEQDFCPAPESLVLFKVAQFLIRANIEHPLYMGLCQLFFDLLLTRVSDDDDQVHGVMERLYDYDRGLMEKIKQMLCKLELHYDFLQETNFEARQMFNLVKAFQLWLVDTDLDQYAADETINLPSEYAPNHLQLSFRGIQDFWHHCTDKHTILTVHRMMIEVWYNLYRVLPTYLSAMDNIPSGGTTDNDLGCLLPTLAIVRRLEQSYTEPQPIVVPEQPTELQDLIDALKKPPTVRVKCITESLRIVKQHIEKTHWSMKDELRLRETELFELYQQLYVNENKQLVQQGKCSMLYCTGAASIKLHTKCAAIDKNVQDRIAARLGALESFLQLVINVPPYIMKHTIMLRELWNSLFVEYCSETNRASAKALSDVIRTMLRTMLHEVSDANFVPPLTFAVRLSLDTYRCDLANIMLEEVGQMFAGALEEGLKPSSVIIAMLENIRIPVRPLLQVYGQLVKQKSGNLERSMFLDLFGNKLHLTQWLKQHNITPDEVDQFATLTVIGIYNSRPADSVGQSRSSDQTEQDIQFVNMLLSHLEILASLKFPENFGKILQHTLNAYTHWPTLPPTMLLLLLNVLRSRANLPNLQLGMEESALRLANRQFAEANCTEPVLSFEMLELIIVTVTEHFARQCDNANTWNGLYKRHSAYVEVIGMLLGLLSHSFLLHGMHDNRIRTVQDNLLPAVYRMFEPWVVPYGADTSGQQQPKESSIRHTNNDKAKWMFSVLLQTVDYALEKVLVAYADTDHGSQILLYFLHWYLEWFVDPRIIISVLYVFNTLVLDLPWERLQPSELLIARMHVLLEHHSPECHELLACVFVRCNWTAGGGQSSLPAWLQRTHAAILTICVRLAYEPVVRSDDKVRSAMVLLLQYFAGLTWESLHVAELTPALDWFVMTGDPGSMLRSTKEICHDLDEALISYLEIVGGMRFNEANRLVPGGKQLLKRKLYISVVVRMLMNVGRASGGKVAANVQPQLAGAVQQLLRAIGDVLDGLPLQQDMGSQSSRLIEARGMMTELLTSIKKWQTESTLSLFVDELLKILQNDPNSSLFSWCVLESATLLDSPTEHWMRLIESALSNYFCSASDASWLQALQTVGYTAISRWNYALLDSLPLCLELFFLHHWFNARGDPIAQLKVLIHLKLEVHKPFECQLYPNWCSSIYGLLTVQPLQHAAIRYTIGLLGSVTENNTFWVVGVLKKIIGKEKTAPTRVNQCLIAYALAALLAHGYAGQTPWDEHTEADDYSDAYNCTEMFTLKDLVSAPERRISRKRIASMALEHFKTMCSASEYKEHQSLLISAIESGEREPPQRILQHAKNIIILLDSRAKPFLNTLQEAIVGGIVKM